MTYKRKEVIGPHTLYLGDCWEVMPTLGKFDAVVTDPPYGIGVNTNNLRFSGGNSGHRRQEKQLAGTGGGVPIMNDERPIDPAILLDVAKHKIIWGWNNIADRLPRGACLVWLKRNDDAFGSFLSDAELAWKSHGHGVYCRRDLSNNAIANDRVHPTQKPVGVMKWCIEHLPSPNTTILDPFMGSGTTGVACQKLGRVFTGIELDPGYFDIACKRIEEAMRQPDLFVETPTKPEQLSIDLEADA